MNNFHGEVKDTDDGNFDTGPNTFGCQTTQLLLSWHLCDYFLVKTAHVIGKAEI